MIVTGSILLNGGPPLIKNGPHHRILRRKLGLGRSGHFLKFRYGRYTLQNMCRQRTWSARRSAPSNNGAPTVHADGSHLLALRCHKRPPLWIPRPFPTSTRPLVCVTTRSLTPSRSLIILHCTVGVDKKDGEEPLRMLHVCYGGHRHVFGTIDPCNFRGARVLWCAGGLVVRCGVPARLPGKITCGS